MEHTNSPINARVFELMRGYVPLDYHERFLNFMARSMKEIELVTLSTVDELWDFWIEAFARENRDKKMLGDDY